jgi:Xaa-Pro dipeptidase
VKAYSHALVFEENRRKILQLIEEKNLDAIVLAGESNITYTTGIRSPTGMLLLSHKCPPSLAVPLLEFHRISLQMPPEFEIYVVYRGGEENIEAEIPKKKIIKGGLTDGIHFLIKKCGIEKLGADLSNVNYQTGTVLKNKTGAEDVSTDIAKVRAVKSNLEIELIQEAIRIAEDSFRSILDKLTEGTTESRAAGLLFSEMLSRGAWYEAFPSIVAFYSNSAYPHHTPTSLVLGEPGPVLVDWGAIYKGYRSDMTRTFWYKNKVSENFRNHLEQVIEAQEEAIDMISAGVEAWEVDNAARRVLGKYGLAKFFIHGLGHGVGVDIHEEPYLRPGAKTVLEKGMIVTVEPGIYLPGLYGIRVEDMILVTSSGARVLTRLPKTLP